MQVLRGILILGAHCLVRPFASWFEALSTLYSVIAPTRFSLELIEFSSGHGERCDT